MAASTENSMKFTINRSWDDNPLNYSIDIQLRQERDFVIMEVNAPFFRNETPMGVPGEPFPQLWDHEVVEAFFLGEDDHYLEVELAPHGQHLVLFLSGPSNAIKWELPLKFTTHIKGRKWTGKAEIPLDYFPPNVTLFNAFAMHTDEIEDDERDPDLRKPTYDERRYDALYPAPSGRYKNPDFHRLNLFKPIDFDSLVKRDKQLSNLWKEALEEVGISYNKKTLVPPPENYEFIIDHSWDDDPRGYSIYIMLSKEEDYFVNMYISAPFFMDPNPGGIPGEPYPLLWNHEVVEAFFLGEDNMYLEVELAPYGQHLLLLLAGHRNPIKFELPLTYNTNITGDRWYGKAEIPIDYFPPNVTLFNAYAIHGTQKDRVYDALYPAPPGCYEDPDFHRLFLFKPIDFKSLIKRDYQLSDVWKQALEESGIRYDEESLNSPENRLEFRIKTDWQGFLVNHPGVRIKLQPEDSFVLMNIYAPYYFGKRPEERQPFPKLWKYDVVQACFLGSSTMCLEVECSPHGQYLVILLAGPKNIIKAGLIMEYSAQINGHYWTAKAKIPARYFPPYCSMFNVYHVYGPKYERRVEALYPAEKFRHKQPNLHWYRYFGKINFDKLLNRCDDFSLVWKTALEEAGIAYKEEEFYIPNPLSFDTEPIVLTEMEMYEIQKVISSDDYYTFYDYYNYDSS